MKYANFAEFEQSDEYKLGKLVEVKFADGTGYGRYTSGDQFWYKDGDLHRDDDLPAVIWDDGSQFWYKNGLRHRDGDRPAIIYSNDSKFWYKNGLRHRDGDLPATIYASDAHKIGNSDKLKFEVDE
jgi:hypothetical protein